jgi:hypothetical protein
MKAADAQLAVGLPIPMSDLYFDRVARGKGENLTNLTCMQYNTIMD